MLLVKKARRPHPSHMTFRPVGSGVEPFLAGYSSSSSTLPEVHQVHAIPGDPPSHPENLLTINALIPPQKTENQSISTRASRVGGSYEGVTSDSANGWRVRHPDSGKRELSVDVCTPHTEVSPHHTKRCLHTAHIGVCTRTQKCLHTAHRGVFTPHTEVSAHHTQRCLHSTHRGVGTPHT